MLQALFADRFQLATHRDTREVPVYALVKARGDGQLGPRLVANGCVWAMQEQLGLKLDGTRAQVDVLVIDRVERPSPD